jgi:hypothetical protein
MSNYFSIFLFIGFTLFSSFCFSQEITITVTGRLTNSFTGAGVSGAKVSIFTDTICNARSLFVRTDSNGMYSVSFTSPEIPQCGIHGYVQNCNGTHAFQQSWYGNAQKNVRMDFQTLHYWEGECKARFLMQKDEKGTVKCTNQSKASAENLTFSTSWSIDEMKMSKLENPVFQLSKGQHTICMTIIDTKGCASQSCQEIYVETADLNKVSEVFFSMLNEMEN